MAGGEPKVCVVIPAFNEARVIREVITTTKQVLDQSGYAIDIVVVNDASTDETASEARAAGAFVIDHILNSGAGGATATGLSYANQNGYDIAATMDADGQHKAEDIVRGVEELQSQRADLLIGSRLLDASVGDMSSTKRIGNWGLSFVTMLLFGVYTSDSQSGLRLYSREALERLRWKTSGYEFCSEMIWRARQLDLAIGEFPIRVIYTDYSKAKGQNNWNAINILKSLVRRRLTEMFE